MIYHCTPYVGAAGGVIGRLKTSAVNGDKSAAETIVTLLTCVVYMHFMAHLFSVMDRFRQTDILTQYSILKIYPPL